ncbi:hypothetical protein RND71_030669 [Anisodus tanguticus]|uniref:Uncharacterized protein n=1 Tax=Anisodus tanguticus TaxID=243964 RepID=A0AAE1V5Q0_9SOLA|nr:hypothetical protein RND71_030669 [Anisodus tanguticus]
MCRLGNVYGKLCRRERLESCKACRARKWCKGKAWWDTLAQNGAFAPKLGRLAHMPHTWGGYAFVGQVESRSGLDYRIVGEPRAETQWWKITPVTTGIKSTASRAYQAVRRTQNFTKGWNS